MRSGCCDLVYTYIYIYMYPHGIYISSADILLVFSSLHTYKQIYAFLLLSELVTGEKPSIRFPLPI